MKFTFVVPVYNSEDTIEECLRALLKQSDAELEKDYDILVVNDGSTDETSRIIEKIKDEYSIKVVTLKENKGRIEARKAGALESQTELLVFIDSRVIASEDLAYNISKLEYTPAIAGDFNLRKEKYKSVYDTVLFLIRRRYYGKNTINKIGDFYINKSNFLRSPKGTTLFVIDRNLFLNIIPTNTTKTTSDDTLLFHNLVFIEENDVLRTAKLKVTYLQRRELSKLIPWLYHRGKLFSDYYLTKGGVYRNYFFMGLTLGVLTCALAFVFPVIFLMLLILYFLLCAYLSENIKDFFILVVTFPLIVAVFFCGIVMYFYNKILK